MVKVNDLHIHVHIDGDSRIEEVLTELKSQSKNLEAFFNHLTKQEKLLMTDLTALTDAVTQDTDVVNSAITLITGLAAEIQAAGTDPVALQSIVDQLNTNNTQLAAAVTANTPAAPPVAPLQ